MMGRIGSTHEYGGRDPLETFLPFEQMAVIASLGCRSIGDRAKCLHLMQATQARIVSLAGTLLQPSSCKPTVRMLMKSPGFVPGAARALPSRAQSLALPLR